MKSKNAEDVYAKACNIYYMQPEGRKQMGLAGRKKIEKEFDRNIVIEAYKERLSPLF